VVIAAVGVIVGGFCQLYVIIIGGQAFPQTLFPGMIVESGFGDGAVAAYAPSGPEIGLGISGVALALIIVTLAVRVLPLFPKSLD